MTKSGRIRCALILALLPGTAAADPCRLETSSEADTVRRLVHVGTTLVHYCWYCDEPEPLPVRVKSMYLRHREPDEIQVTAWEPEPHKVTFPGAALTQALTTNDGPLATFIRKDIDRQHTDTTGYLGPNDPYLLEEKQNQYAMRLRFVQAEHAARTWDELYLNDEPADPRLLYTPAPPPMFHALGMRIGCDMDGAPAEVSFVENPRDPAREQPPQPFVVDITGQCFDGACPAPIWHAINPVPLRSAPRSDAQKTGMLDRNDALEPIRTETHVSGRRAAIQKDHRQFFTGDVIYLLDSQGEGYQRVWHYGETFIIDTTGINVAGRVGFCEKNASCWATVGESATDESEVWWAKVRRSDGVEGWVQDPATHLDGVLRSE